MSVNFNVVEGVDILDNIQDDFLRLYNDNSLRVVDVCKELDISKSQYQNLRQRMVRRGIISGRRDNRRSGRKTKLKKPYVPKNYHYNSKLDTHIVQRKCKYYSCFKKEEDAKEFVRLMRECDWDYSRKDDIREEVLSGCYLQ